ncbi:MAG: YceI family protein [Alphaproteobacteria bacterium]|uniref:YceI family protein n=1 Tax=Hyphomonas sp. TaxID=87 RepID=UPI001E0283F0|nr:YceI family protein [Hyphomonas sp.]MBU3921162.1 YceI family protein [Alphaproteobacteria bacterium]MBU4062592.1 YceI family protein [Alphaproteobacteria bacterium]MBU4163943.1 YceI family protein [Alphaproteobacteria bacterium]MBU4567397.1 YceI family protein [Alphaproteobacteria bacterium]
MRLFLISASALALVACTPAAETAPAADAPAVAEPVEAEAAPVPEVAYGQAATYKADPTHTSVVWRVNHLGLSKYTARFKTVDATLAFNPQDLAANSVEVTLDPLSVETDFQGDYKGTHKDSPFDSWNDDLGKSPTWFNATAFPQITFKSTSAAQTGPATGTVTGDLTLLGVTKPVTLDVTYNGMVQLPWTPEQDRIGFSARTTLKRSDFGMTGNMEFIGDDVEIIIETEFLEVAG